MNEVKEKKVRTPDAESMTREERIRRLKVAERRKKRKKKLQMQIILAVCVVLVIACSFALAIISKDDEKNEVVKPVSEEIEEEITGKILDETDSDDEVEEEVVEEDDTEQKDETEKAEEVDDEDVKEFSELDYYKDEYKARYVDYAKANPDMSASDVVWRVNAHQDKPKYGYDVAVTKHDPLMIVNKYYKVSDSYTPPNLQTFDGHKLTAETGAAYERMRDAAKEQGLSIKVVSGYRSVEYQRNLYNRYLANDSQASVDRYSARPGYSEHHTGMAMDIFGSNCNELRDFVNSPEYPWVRDHCHEYGFIIRYLKETEDITGYESEPWHLRYVGEEVSTDMKNKGINNYEEYYAKYID